MVKAPPANVRDTGDTGSILGLRRSLEKGMATHFSIFAWNIPWREESGGLQSMWSQKGADMTKHVHTKLLFPNPQLI